MAAELEKVEFKPPRKTVYANVTAQPHTDAASIKKLLVDQIVKPVRWEQTMQTLLAQGDARWIELAPGRVLTGLVKKINRKLPIETLSTAEAIAKPA
jgi:[acyl-carrier-protein] S-malonyltransferase